MNTDDARSKWLLLGGTAVVAVGSLLPWATVSAGFVTVTKAGTDGDGVITLLFALVIGGLALAKWKTGLSRGVVITSLVLGLLILAIAAYDTVDIASTDADTEFVVSTSVGIGLWLTLLGSIAMVAGSIWELRSPTPSGPVTGPVAWGGGPSATGHPSAPPTWSAQQPLPPSAIPTSAPPPQHPPPPPPPPPPPS